MVKSGTNATEIDEAERILMAFRTALGNEERGKVLVYKRDSGTKKMNYCYTLPFTVDDEGFIEQVRYDYPQGGEFSARIKKNDGTFVEGGTEYFSLDALPKRELDRLAEEERQRDKDTKPKTAAGPVTMDPFMQMLMTNQQRSDERSARNFELIIGGIVSVATAAVPALLKRDGNKGESAGELLNMLLDAKEKIMPREGEDPFDKTLDRMAKMKTVMGSDDKDTGGDGLIGLAKSLMPGFMQLAATQAAQSAPGLPAPQQPRPAVAPPAPDNPVEKYRPLMDAVKILLARQEPPGMIATYIDMQLRVGALSTTDMTELLDRLNATPQLFLPTLAMYEITLASHAIAIATALALINRVQDGDELQRRWAAYGITPGADLAALVATCLSYFSDDLDDDAEEAGVAGDGTGLGTYGPNGGGGIDPATNPTLGLDPNATAGTA